MRVSTTGRIGIALVLVGPVLLGCAIRWMAPHPNEPLEMPVSLSPGHVITGNFSLNPGDLYYVDIEIDKRLPIRADCEPRSVLRTRWVLSSDARDAWGNGYATEALTAIVEIAEGLGVIRLYALCHPDHPAFARVLQKCGFRLEQRLEQFAEFPNLDPRRRETCLRYVREEAAPG
jgi:hypothetical protein